MYIYIYIYIYIYTISDLVQNPHNRTYINVRTRGDGHGHEALAFILATYSEIFFQVFLFLVVY